ncbi:MAG: 3-keto-5-aminohexanoate cleavage protein [Gammaproteobacteria bacterium]|nr:3-keto-5-aminohexanoate cleavage protein [Gammaproteobacteria bacterium]
MNQEVVITCAVTGSGETQHKHPDLPITPKQIADACVEAANAGAAVTHIHVRDPETGSGGRDHAMFAEVAERVRASGVDVVLNLTTGMGGDYYVGEKVPTDPGPGTDFVLPIERVSHIDGILPEICSLDCGTMNFGDGNLLMINTPDHLRVAAKHIQELGVKPELEVFDTGHVWMANRMFEEGLIDEPPLYQICLGIPYGAPATTGAMKAMCDMLPEGANWTAFGISRHQMPMVAQAVLLGGHVRVGLEDNLYLERGKFASNGQLVEKAVKIVEMLGAKVVGPQEAREKFKLTKQK